MAGDQGRRPHDKRGLGPLAVTAPKHNFPISLDEAHHRLIVGAWMPLRLLVFDTGPHRGAVSVTADCPARPLGGRIREVSIVPGVPEIDLARVLSQQLSDPSRPPVARAQQPRSATRWFPNPTARCAHGFARFVNSPPLDWLYQMRSIPSWSKVRSVHCGCDCDCPAGAGRLPSADA